MNQQENDEHNIEKFQKGFQYKISLIIPVLILFLISPFLKLDQPGVRFFEFFFIFITFVFTEVILEEKDIKSLWQSFMQQVHLYYQPFRVY